MSGLRRVSYVVLFSLLLTVALAASANADVIENLVFTGTATCLDTFCSGFGSGPVTGTYTLDVTTQTIVGAWSFSMPLGVISSGDAGATAGVVNRFGDVNPFFEDVTFTPPFDEFIQFFFPGTDTQELGALATNISSDACTPIAGAAACHPDYIVTGVTAIAPVPEPSALMLLATGLLFAGLALKKNLF